MAGLLTLVKVVEVVEVVEVIESVQNFIGFTVVAIEELVDFLVIATALAIVAVCCGFVWVAAR